MRIWPKDWPGFYDTHYRGAVEFVGFDKGPVSTYLVMRQVDTGEIMMPLSVGWFEPLTDAAREVLEIARQP